jgi:CRP-like cAMP-binding protein
MAKRGEKAVGVESTQTERALQQIANCLAYLVISTEELRSKSKNDLIPILASLGFDRNSIASILQTTPETVSVCLSRLRAKALGKGLSRPESENQAGAS